MYAESKPNIWHTRREFELARNATTTQVARIVKYLSISLRKVREIIQEASTIYNVRVYTYMI